MAHVTRTLSWPLRALAAWAGDHPFRAAGLLAALAGVLATLLAVGALTSTGLVAEALTVDSLTAFATARPAYPVAVLVGMGLLVRP